jgi:hypothetical protein
VYETRVRGKCELRASENRRLGKMFKQKKDEVTGKWKKKICNEGLRNLYFWPNIMIIKSRKIK